MSDYAHIFEDGTKQNRLNRARELLANECRGEVKTFAERISRRQGYTGNILRGVDPIGPKMARTIEAAFSKPDKWLDDEPSTNTVAEPAAKYEIVRSWFASALETNEYVPIPTMSGKLVAGVTDGFEIHIDEDATPYYYRSDWIKKKRYSVEKLRGWHVQGSSMERSINDGDRILFNMDEREPKHGVCFVVNINHAPAIKRLKRIDGQWWITSDNPAYSMHDIQLEDASQIIGEVIEKTSSVI